MSIKRGVVATYTSDSARPISIKSVIPIALVLSSLAAVPPAMYGYDGVEDAIADMTQRGATDGDGTILKYLKLGVLFNATAPVVVSVVLPGVDEAETKTRVLEAIDALKTSPSALTYRADIVVAPEWGYDIDIVNRLVSLADKLGARAFVDIDAETNAVALDRRNAYGSDRLTLIKSGGYINGIEYDGGALMGWLRVQRDGDVDGLGWSRSISNLTLPISAVKYPTDFILGRLDESDTLTENNVTSIIFHKGFRTWEYATTSEDAIWQDARRIRIFDKASEAVLDGIFFAIDKGISELRSAKKSLRSFMSDLIGQEVVLGFEVRLDEERTTATAITKGEFYFIIDAQEMPSPRLIMVTFNRVDRYTPLLYEILAAA